MSKRVNRIVFIVLMLPLLYGLLWLASVKPAEEINEYPWWEDYADYWFSTWAGLYKTQDCRVTAQHKKWGIVVRQVAFCFSETVGTRIETGLLGLPLGKDHWDGVDYTKHIKVMAKHFPNGPYSFAYFQQPGEEKRVYEKPLDYLDDIFKPFTHIALYAEFNRSRDYILKWTKPLRVQVFDFSNGMEVEGKSLSHWVRELVAELATITGHDIAMGQAQPGERPFAVFFFDLNQPQPVIDQLALWSQQSISLEPEIVEKFEGRSHFEALVNDFNKTLKEFSEYENYCWGRTSEVVTEPYKSYEAEAYIPINHDQETLLGCIHEEMAQLLGLANDWRAAEPSMFNDHSPYNRLTDLDKLWLRLLYEEEITVGMKRRRLGSEALSKLLEYQRNGELDGLTKKVYQPYDLSEE